MLRYGAHLKQPARTLRGNPTDAERLLWSRLRRKQIFAVQFYRQKPIGNFIVDFSAPGAELVVEVDGSQRFETTHADCDQQRTACLERCGLQVLRFTNLEVLRSLERVVDRIAGVVRMRANPPCPPFSKGE